MLSFYGLSSSGRLLRSCRFTVGVDDGELPGKAEVALHGSVVVWAGAGYDRPCDVGSRCFSSDSTRT